MLVFHNKGVLPIEGFTTFGMSAKPGSTNPIGKFGTGLKNAVAIILRLGGTVTVWRGATEYVFYTKDEEFRGTTFKRVRMKKRTGLLSRWKYEVLPFTTELGKHWEPWMAYRELEANTRDEEDGITHAYANADKTVWQSQNVGAPNTTTIIVDCAEIEDAHVNKEKTFLPEGQTPIYEDSRVKIYDGPSDYVFYRGMRVTDLRVPSMYTYELTSVVLTEDRTSMYTFLDNNNIRDSLLACDIPMIVDRIVRKSDKFLEGSFNWDEKKPSVSSSWRHSLSHGGLSPRFATLRDNLAYGLGESEDVEVNLEVRQWEGVMDILEANGTDVLHEIREQMLAAGWKPKVRPVDEIAEAVPLDPEAIDPVGEINDDYQF